MLRFLILNVLLTFFQPDFIDVELDKDLLPDENVVASQSTLNNTMHANSNGEAGTVTQYQDTGSPSFDAITNSIELVHNVPFASRSSSQFSLSANQYSMHCNSHANPNVPGTEIPISIMDFLSPKLYPNNIATPIEDSLLVKALEQHEAHSSKFSKPETSTWQQRVNNSFKSATLVIQEPKNSGQRVIFSDGIENDFYQTLVGLLPKLTYRYVQKAYDFFM